MGLITKPPSWAYCTTNLTGTPSTATVGTAFTAGANNADGTSVEVLSALTHDVEYLIVGIEGTAVSASVTDALADVLIDPAGGSSWSSLISDLLVGQCLTVSAGNANIQYYHFPLWIPAGASLGVTCRTRRATDITTCSAHVIAYGGNANPASWWCGQRVTSIGIDASISAGTAHTPGNTGSFSTWTDFGSTLSANCGAIQFGIQGNNISGYNALAYFMEFGTATVRIGPTMYLAIGSAEVFQRNMPGPIFCSLPAGTQLQTRATCSGTAQSVQVASYAVH